MGNRAVISKDQILDIAFDMATEQGVSSLSVRAVAQACSVAVGTVYNSYPTKASLVSDVVARFWERSLARCMPAASNSTDFVGFCETLEKNLASALGDFRRDWLAGLEKLDSKELKCAKGREQAAFEHVERGLATALENDERIHHERLTGALEPTRLCRFVWHTMMLTVSRNDGSGETLFALLREALYE